MSKWNTIAVVVVASTISTVGPLALFAQSAGQPNWKSIQRNCAQANLELAEARLASAMNQKKQVAGSISDDMLDALKAGVQVAKDELAQISSNRPTNPFGPQIAAAQATLRGLEANYAKLQEANSVQAGAVSDFDLRTAKAEVSVAKARLAALQSLSRQPVEVRMQWQIEQLQDDIRSLWARPLIED